MTLGTELTTAAAGLDLRLVQAFAGHRSLTAREEGVLAKLKEERGEGLFADILYTLTHKVYPTRQAKYLWEGILAHQATLTHALKRDPGLAVTAHDYLVNIVKEISGVSLIEESKFLALASTATRDGLTGLYDKTTFHRLLVEEIARGARHNRPCTFVMLDIDHFKKINDTFGHADGDMVLVQLADVINHQIRTTDIAGRIGGEEFGIILPETEGVAGGILAERLRIAVEKKFFGTPYKTTISLGLACFQEPEKTGAARPESDAALTAATLYKKADKALYQAKAAGRNQVMLAAS